MPFVGFTGVANQANTSDGFANEVGAQNPPNLVDQWGLYTGDTGIVDLYHGIPAPATEFFIAMENSGYVLQETSYKIKTEIST